MPNIDEYFKMLNTNLGEAYRVAREARAKNFDPEPDVEITPAEDVAGRVQAIVGPPGVAEGIRRIESDEREKIAFEIVGQILEGRYGKIGDRQKLIEQAIRTGLAILTEGVLVAPTEGIAAVEILKNPDGSDYLSVYFAGPIRSAGGTSAAMSVVLADYARRKFGISAYRPTDTEVERYVEEIYRYDTEKRLQYRPTEDEIRTIVRNCPICIDGEPTEEFEVSVHKGLERVKTDRVRGGVALVIAEGIAQKASKLLKITRKFDLDWNWLESIVKVDKPDGKVEIRPNDRYLEDIAAGRPIFCYPSSAGGFRLRYGRTRMTGIASKAVHPATMYILDEFLAIGTQMKVEKPGKGCVVTPCDSIAGPIVKLYDGSVVKIESAEQALNLKNKIEKILFLGDILISYNDFIKSNHPLLPPAFCEEVWLALAAEKGKKISKSEQISADTAFKISEELKVPLHPKYTYYWKALAVEEVRLLGEWLKKGELVYDWFRVSNLKVESAPEKSLLEKIWLPHRVEGAHIFIEGDNAYALLRSLGLLSGGRLNSSKFDSFFKNECPPTSDVLAVISQLSGVEIWDIAPTFIGARMGRPEKAKEREMKPPPHVIFPIGSLSGGKTRNIMKAYNDAKKSGNFGVMVEIARLVCPNCKSIEFTNTCMKCGTRTTVERVCPRCGKKVTADSCCGTKPVFYDNRSINIVQAVEKAIERTGNSKLPEEIKGVKGMTSAYKIPEPLEKGILRAKHGIKVYKDGTVRFDATDVPLTHFCAKEIGISVAKLRELGYTHDMHGKELTSDEQIVELMPQDIIISENGLEYLFKVANFIDDMLVYLYGIKPFYNLKSKEELIGHLVIGISPHTSAGVLGRIIGTTKARVCYAHPYFHACKRRNADGDEDSVMLLLDALINFSKKFLPEKRGGMMDAPRVLTTRIEPKEVDDEVHGMEICEEYPIELYKAAMDYAPPSSVKIPRVKHKLDKPDRYEGLNFTHSASSINDAPIRSKYVTLKTMDEKIEAQFSLQKKISAVDIKDAAERLLLSHFLPDIYGNRRSFSRQSFRCVDCNKKYRRVPLRGKCTCGGKLLLTVSKGGVEKYLAISHKIVDEYGLPKYLKQRLILVESDISSTFVEEKKQVSLAEFM
ncbi:MAG: DNA polymerase II large subunit [Candidatus Micrarchaeia archaeon]